MASNLFDAIKWDDHGLVPAIAQDHQSGRLLMMAWMNQDALKETVETNRAVYWSRSRNSLWRKGEQSGHFQIVKEVRLDCDGDVIILSIEQVGGVACHTGRESCFYRRWQDGTWQVVEDIVKDPQTIYGAKE